MQKLRAGGFLFLPQQQRAIERAEFNPYIYDLTPKAKRWLMDRCLAEPTVRPTGHWWHAHQIACTTSAMDISAARHGLRYIPAHVLLTSAAGGLGVQTSGKLLVPDQLFALDYGGSYRAFVLEVDRGTEPVRSSAIRKSLASSIEAYAQAQVSDQLRRTYGLRATIIVLWVFNAKSRAELVLKLLSDHSATIRAAHLVRCTNAGLPEKSLTADWLQVPWERSGLAPVSLSPP